MNKELEDKVFMAIFGHSNGLTSRREASEYVKKYYGEEAYNILQGFWKSRYLSFNIYGYLVITKKGWSYWNEIK